MFSVFIDPLFNIPGLVDHLVCYIDDIAVVHMSREGITQAIATIRTYLARLGLLLNPSKSNVMGYVHTFPDEFGNLVDLPATQKVDCFGNTYFDEVGMPIGHPDTVPIYLHKEILYGMQKLDESAQWMGDAGAS